MVIFSELYFVFATFLITAFVSCLQGGSDSTGRIARNSANPENSVTFNDIEGIDEAKYEVMELVDALRNPGKYSILGARAPKG